MLKATQVRKPVQAVLSIMVTLEGVTNEDDETLAAAAMAAAHETPGSLFGYHVYRPAADPHLVSVALHRD